MAVRRKHNRTQPNFLIGIKYILCYQLILNQRRIRQKQDKIRLWNDLIIPIRCLILISLAEDFSHFVKDFSCFQLIRCNIPDLFVFRPHMREPLCELPLSIIIRIILIIDKQHLDICIAVACGNLRRNDFCDLNCPFLPLATYNTYQFMLQQV